MRVIDLPFKVSVPMLACGADMKGAFALARGNKAYLVDGFGPLDDPDNLDAYEASIRAHEKKLGIKPAVIIHDLHPEYRSGRFARAHAAGSRAKACGVQHHEAHVASAVCEHRIVSDVIGVAFDGTGYGHDGCIWGGEFFTGSPKGFQRAAHLDYVSVPGGEAAIREPWRMAVSYLYKIFGAKMLDLDIDLLKTPGVNKRLTILRKMMDGKINSPLTSSAGRLFDAAAGIILSKAKAGYEAELPIELERIADGSCDGSYSYDAGSKDGAFLIDMSASIRGILSDIRKGVDRKIISARFHNTIAEMIAGVASRLRRKRPRLNKVVLSGGVFQNIYLKKRALSLLNKKGFDAYAQAGINTNDYGIPIGQLAIAGVGRTCV